jgi:hypothetical protein
MKSSSYWMLSCRVCCINVLNRTMTVYINQLLVYKVGIGSQANRQSQPGSPALEYRVTLTRLG